MAKFVAIDLDTYLGYNFLTKQYFIVNKNTTTYRTEAEEIEKVLKIVAPNDTFHTVEWLKNYAKEFEELETLAYTISDTGAYISTIQINSYSDYPIELNAEKNKLYIKNTNIVFDLSLNEARSSRISVIQAYYKEHLGLDLSTIDLTDIYNFMINTYTPYVYNLILDTTTDPIYYSNSFACSNWTGKGKSTYQADVNPNEEFSLETIAYIVNVNSSTRAITLSDTIPDTITIGTTISVSNATTILDTYTYSADGNYTVSSIDTDTNTIYTKETISGSYTYNYPIAYLITSSVNIESIDRDTSTVTLTSTVPDSIQVGDIIYIEGTQQTIEGETVSCDGEYIVGNINDNTITLQSQPNTNYTYSTGSYPTISKRLFIGNIESIEKPSSVSTYNITLTSTPQQTLSINAHIVVFYDNSNTYYTINSVEANILTCTYLSGTLKSYTVNYPLLQIPVPYSNILLSVTTSTDEAKLPTGEFMLDDFNQCQEYLGLLDGNTLPTDSVYAKLGAEVGAEDIQIVYRELTPIPVNFLGLYSQVYASEE